jgi:ABC-2 type transport system permease protein
MKTLILSFLKIFFRNPRTIFFVIFLPAGIFLTAVLLDLEGVIRFTGGFSYKDFLQSGIIALALMQTGIYTVAYTLIDYRRTRILKRLAVTPLSAGRLLAAQIISRFLIACLQVSALLILGKVFFGTTVKGLLYLPIFIFLGSTIFLDFGFLIASVARDYEEAAPYTALIGLPLIILGDVFFPIKNLPPGLVTIADFLPLKPLASTIRHFLLGGRSPDLARDILVLLVWFVVLTLVSQYIFAKKVYK